MLHLIASLVLTVNVGGPTENKGSGNTPPPPPPGWCAPPCIKKYACGASGCGWICELPPRPQTERGQLVPSVMVTQVIYAVPGRSGFVSYSSGSILGMTISNASSWRNEVKVGISQENNVLGFATLGFKFEFSNWQEGGTTNVTDLSTTTTTTYRKPGEDDFVDHDDDEVWFVVKPIFDVAITEADPYWGPAHVEWALSPGVEPTVYYMLLGELNGHYPILPNVQQFLDDWRVTQQDLDALRSVDPFAADPALDPAQNPDRFTLLGVFPYKPPPEAGSVPMTQTFDVKHRNLGSTQKDSSQSYITELEIHGGGGFLGLAKAKLSFDDRFTWKNSSSRKDYSELDTDDQITVGQPAFGYAGPTVLRAYQDNIYRTYVTHLDRY